MSKLKIAGLIFFTFIICNFTFLNQKSQEDIVFERTQNEKPLMVLRFNQPRVFYEKHLETIIKKTLKINPESQFDVIGFVPKINSARDTRILKKNSQSEMNRLTNNLTRLGISQNNLTTIFAESADITSNEIRIFVR